MASQKSEDTLLFVGLTPSVIRLKKIYKYLVEFAEIKQSIDLSDRFNVILFEKNGPIYLNDFTFEFENILDLMKEHEKDLVRANIAGGVFVACTFIIDVFKKISDKAFRLIILIDKGSLNIPDHYIPVLIDLLDKVKGMPFYIDIIRIATDDPQGDLTLMKIAERTNGNLHEVKTPKELMGVLAKLADKKSPPEQAFYEETSKSIITEENEAFFEHLADDPKILVTLETCAICFKKDDRTVVECPNCKTKTHMDCWAHWAKTSNIGIPSVFRCHQCFNLLKLDKNFVDIVQTGAAPPPEWEEPKVDLVQYLQEIEAKNKPQPVQIQDPLMVAEDTCEQDLEEEKAFCEEDEKDLQEIPRFTGTTPELEEIPKPPVKPAQLQEIPKPSEEPRKPQVQAPKFRPNTGRNIVAAPELRPSKKPAVKPMEHKKKEVTIVFCPSCSKITNNTNRYCPYCGYKLF